MMKKKGLNRTILSIAATCALACTGSFALAQNELQTINAGPDASAGDRFGNAVDLAGNYAIVGARLDTGSDNGGAFIYELMGGSWMLQVSLMPLPLGPSAVGANNEFGYSVATDGNVAVVGAPFHVVSGDTVGAAYVFRRSGSTWTFETKLLGSGGDHGDRFGDSVDVQGNRIIVGGTQQSTGAGKAWIYQHNGGGIWGMPTVLAPGGLENSDQFGHSVALNGNTAIVGARFDDGSGNSVSNSGAVYVFTESGGVWTLQETLRAADASLNAQFGFDVALTADRAVIGAPQDSGQGAVYVFDRSGGVWSETDKLLSDATDASDEFGHAVDVDGDRIAAGARTGSLGDGHVAIFQRSGGAWDEDPFSPVLPLFAGANDQYGTSVAISGALVLGGAPGNDSAGAEAGNATFFEVDLTAPGDSDGDGLDDATEEFLANGGDCPDPNNPDSDGDGLSDGYENDFGPNMCDADSDDDGLLDGDEVNVHGTDPTVADSDGDGLQDFTEVDSGCQDPLNADTDGDGLSDGHEVLISETDPCNADTDDDGLDDAIDPEPNNPGAPTNFIEQELRDLSTEVNSLNASVSAGIFTGPNNNANQGRQNALANQLTSAANAVADGDYQAAVDQLTSVLGKIDGLPGPTDWIADSQDKTDLAAEVVLWRSLLELMVP